MPDDIEELRERVESLENRLAALETLKRSTAAPGGIDQYDGYVLSKIEELGHEPSPRHVVRLYQEAGVRDKSKIKQRHKFLKSSGRIQQAIENGGSADA